MSTSKSVVIYTAKQINSEYLLARTSIVDSANHLLAVGQMLTEKKSELGHGNFIPWIVAECDFGESAARKMMASAKRELTTDLTEFDAISISRDIWGNNKPNGSVVEVYSGKQEWYTPEKYIEAARSVMGSIDLDPASCAKANKTVKAETYYTEKQNGLIHPWYGNVFLNPPYAQNEVREFTARIAEAYVNKNIEQGILLTNNSTDTSWWHYAAKQSSAICFTAGRIKFYEETIGGSPTNGQTFMYFGRKVKTFSKIFSEFGLLVSVNG